MRYLDVCAGISAPTVAWSPLGWQCAVHSEIEPFPRSVLSHHYPDIPLHGDFTTIKGDEYGPVDLLVGGTPCQSFSVAGLRGGLADERGNLALEYLRLADRARPRWLVWENVPGVLSSSGGRDFGTFLGGLAQLGYGFAYRVLDAQFFGVPQRRRRVFVVGHLGDWRRAAAVLFERHSLSGHSAPRREAGKGIAGSAQPCPTVSSKWAKQSGGYAGAEHYNLTLAHSLRAEGFDASEDGIGRGTPLIPVGHVDIMPTMQNGADTPAGHNARSGHTKDNYIVPMGFGWQASPSQSMNPSEVAATLDKSKTPAVAFMENIRAEVRTSDKTDALTKGGGKPGQGYAATMVGSQVRRLTPRECERLQGFPDDFTLVPHRGKPAADGPRYKALGNSMAVPVLRWIGERIGAVDSLQIAEAA